MPVAGVTLAAFKVILPPAQTDWSVPASARTSESTVIETVSLVLHTPLVIVQINRLVPYGRFVSEARGSAEFEIVAVETEVHKPVPGAALFALSVAESVPHSVRSEPA